MDHREAREMLHDELDGRLGTDAAGKLREHLGECAECRREAAELASLRRLFTQVPAAPAPADFKGQVMERLPRGRVLAFPRQLAWLAAAAAVALVAFVVAKSMDSSERDVAWGPAASPAAVATELEPSGRARWAARDGADEFPAEGTVASGRTARLGREESDRSQTASGESGKAEDAARQPEGRGAGRPAPAPGAAANRAEPTAEAPPPVAAPKPDAAAPPVAPTPVAPPPAAQPPAPPRAAEPAPTAKSPAPTPTTDPEPAPAPAPAPGDVAGGRRREGVPAEEDKDQPVEDQTPTTAGGGKDDRRSPGGERADASRLGARRAEAQSSPETRIVVFRDAVAAEKYSRELLSAELLRRRATAPGPSARERKAKDAVDDDDEAKESPAPAFVLDGFEELDDSEALDRATARDVLRSVRVVAQVDLEPGPQADAPLFGAAAARAGGEVVTPERLVTLATAAAASELGFSGGKKSGLLDQDAPATGDAGGDTAGGGSGGGAGRGGGAGPGGGASAGPAPSPGGGAPAERAPEPEKAEATRALAAPRPVRVLVVVLP